MRSFLFREVVASLAGSISFGGGDSIFKVHRETVPSIGSHREGLFFNPLTNQLGNFFRFVRSFFEIFQKNFSTTFQEQKKPLSHHEDVIGAEIEKAR